MVVCKFFLQGNCRFGDSCKFDHQLNDNPHSTSILQQQNQNTNTGNVDVNMLIRSVVNDMVAAEKGGQWLLSSYAPFKEKPAFPGFEDRSFEEVRYGFYDAQKSGVLPQYTQQLQIALQEAIAKIKALQNPSLEIVNVLGNIYNTSTAATVNSFPNPSSNVFGNTQNSIFGSVPPPNATIFPQSNPIFGNTGASVGTVFGAANQNAFGSTASMQNPVFGSQSSSVGAKKPIGEANLSIFGGQQNAAQTPFVSQQQSIPLFGNQSAQQPNTVFQTQQNTAFGGPPSSVFQAQQFTVPQQQIQSLPFGIQPQASGIQQQTNAPLFGQHMQTGATNIFGNSAASSTGTAFNKLQPTSGANVENRSAAFDGVTPGVIDERTYSKLEDLSESDIFSFECDSFEFGKIPEKPPTYQMCS